MELVDVPDSKSGVGNYVPVRPRPSADKNTTFSGGIFIRKEPEGRTGNFRFERPVSGVRRVFAKCEARRQNSETLSTRTGQDTSVIGR